VRASTISAAVATAAVLLAGCGGGNPTRDAVSSYIRHVNRIETKLKKPLTSVTTIGAELVPSKVNTVHHSPASLERQLNVALATMQGLDARLEAVPVPRRALPLRTLLVRLAGDQEKLTIELAGLISYPPQLNANLSQLSTASRHLTTAMGATQPAVLTAASVAAAYSAKAAALLKFRTILDAIAVKVRRLHPPEVFLPGYKAELITLEGASAAAVSLANGLKIGSTNLAALVRQFDAALQHSQSLAVQRAQRAAVRRYDRLVQQASSLSAQVNVELTRLQGSIK
jgi:hypothetical protein